MRDVIIDGETVAVVGALDLDETPTGIVPRRLPAWTRPQIPDVTMEFVVQAPSGVRLRLQTDTTAVELGLGTGGWHVAGASVTPRALDCPAIEFVSLNDRIVPAASAANLPDRHDLGAGHVGMIVGRGARTQLWDPLLDWLSSIPIPR